MITQSAIFRRQKRKDKVRRPFSVQNYCGRRAVNKEKHKQDSLKKPLEEVLHASNLLFFLKML